MKLFYAALATLSLMLSKFACSDVPVAPSLQSPVAASAFVGAVAPADAHADREFLAARDAFEKRNLKAVSVARDKFRAALRGYPLANYVEYWWLLANLSQGASFAVSNAADFTAFLTSQPAGVLADGVRKEWLRTLGKLERWDFFVPEYQRVNAEDPELICHQWRHRISKGDRSALTEAKAFWNAARPAPDACDDVFARLAAEKLLPANDAWARVRALLENNQLAEARKSAAMVPGISASFERSTALVSQNPAMYLQNEKLQPASRTSVELFLFAITRLARSDSERAATLLQAQGRKLPDNDLGYAWAQVGLYGAMQHDQEALAWFGKAESLPLNDAQAAWKARAALRAGDWANVRSAINAMSDTERRESAWR
jgi:soluble lytic murein transglycosylase